jgi:hypothetical protein
MVGGFRVRLSSQHLANVRYRRWLELDRAGDDRTTCRVDQIAIVVVVVSGCHNLEDGKVKAWQPDVGPPSRDLPTFGILGETATCNR